MTTIERPQAAPVPAGDLAGKDLAAAVAVEVMGWSAVWKRAVLTSPDSGEYVTDAHYPAQAECRAACVGEEIPVEVWLNERGEDRGATMYWRPDKDLNATWEVWFQMRGHELFTLQLQLVFYRHRGYGLGLSTVWMHAEAVDFCRAAVETARDLKARQEAEARRP